MTQKEALDILKMGHSAFVTGAAGSGKTYLLNQYIKYLKDNDVEVGVTASTGIAASHMGGQTIHAWSGLGIRSSLSPCDIENLEEKPYLWKRFEKTKVLIIDEISMLHHFRLNLVDQVLQSFKRNNLPFGGLQVIFCGDFFQLPPVSREGEEESLFAYHSESWNNLAPKICYLEEQHRQNDDAFLEILNSIRKNNVTPEIIYKLNSSCQGKVNSKDEPTKIYSHNANVDIENERELEKIPGKMFEYEMINKGQEFLAETLKKGCLSPERLRLKKDARVIFTKNNFEEGYVNGTQGIITACDNSGITVRTVSGKTINVNPARWTIEEDGKIKAEIMQYPLRLAWAITVHKSQGMSLDTAKIDLTRAFEPGMGYVALSRVRSLAGLSLVGMNEIALKINEEVFEQDKQFIDSSHEHADDLRNMSTKEITNNQEKYIKSIGGVLKGKIKKNITKKISTIDETKKLFEQGKTIKEMCSIRGVTANTIFNHLEKIKEEDPEINFSYLTKTVSKTKQIKIRAALMSVGTTNGKYLLSPVKTYLGDKFTFDEIRLIRLIMD